MTEISRIVDQCVKYGNYKVTNIENQFFTPVIMSNDCRD